MTDTDTTTYQDTTLYKEWFKAGNNSGFINISPWFWDKDDKPVGKFAIEIGKVDPGNGKVISSTKCFIDGIELAVYLRSVVTGTAPVLYPKRQKLYSPESLGVFGGSGKGENALSRVIKIEYWGSGPDKPGDASGFQWKCGHFEGRVSDTGAIEPVWDKPLSNNMIRRTRQQMAELSYRVDLAMIGFAAKDPYWFVG